jgi:hypothetical protein
VSGTVRVEATDPLRLTLIDVRFEYEAPDPMWPGGEPFTLSGSVRF